MMRGTIEHVWENESKNGQKYLSVQIEGERYTIWDENYFDQLKEGAEVEYEFRQSGNFRNISDLRPVQEQPGPTYRPSPKDRQITRLSCLKSASEIVAPAHMDVDGKQSLVIETAKQFERYVFEDDV